MSNPKPIEERIAELPETIREQKLEGLPEEFKHWEGKSVADVFKSQLEAQSALTKANQDKSTAQKLAETLDTSNKTLEQQLNEFKAKMEETPDPIVEDDDDDDVYVTQRILKKMLAQQQKPEPTEKPLTKEEIIETVRNENIISNFQKEHPELEPNEVNAIIQIGLVTEAKTLNEAYTNFQNLAKKTGLKDGEPVLRHVPGQVGGVEGDAGESESQWDRIKNSQKARTMGSFITPK